MIMLQEQDLEWQYHEKIWMIYNYNSCQGLWKIGYNNATWKYIVWVVNDVSSSDNCMAKALSQSTAGSANKSVDLSIKFPW